DLSYKSRNEKGIYQKKEYSQTSTLCYNKFESLTVILSNYQGGNNMAKIKEKDENMKPEHVRFKKKSQVTDPHDIIKALNLKVGYDLQVLIKYGKIVLVPMDYVTKYTAWLWTEQWQQEEQAVEKYIRDGQLTDAKGLEETLQELDQQSKE